MTFRDVCAAALLCAAAGAGAQEPAPAGDPRVPEIPFESSIDFLKLPPETYLGEVAGVAIDARRHLCVFSRTGSRSTVHGEVASQLFEFGPDGSFVREIGTNLYGFAFAHTVRIGPDGNLWAVDEGTNMIIEFSPAGRVLMFVADGYNNSRVGAGELLPTLGLGSKVGGTASHAGSRIGGRLGGRSTTVAEV